MEQQNPVMTHQTSALQPWIVVLATSLFFFYIFAQMHIFNAIIPGLIKEFQFNAVQLGNLSALYYYGNVLFLFPAGMLLDRLSVKRILVFSMAVTVVCSFIFYLTSSIHVMYITRLLIGIVGSFCMLGCVKIASRWFPPNRMALVIGLCITMAMLGGMIAQTPLTLLADAYGWRAAMLTWVILGVGLFALIATFVKDFPPNTQEFFAKQKAKLNAFGFFHSLGLVLKNPQNWLGGLYICFINLPIFIFATWGSIYLVQAHNLARTEASYVISMLFIGAIVGSPLIGWISDKIGRRKLPMIIGAIVSIVVMLLIMYSTNLSLTWLLILFLALGIITSAQVVGYPLIVESNSPTITATASSIGSTLIMSGGTLMPVFGWLLELKWDHKMVDGLPIYSISDCRLAVSMMLIAFIIGLITSLLVKETHCQAKKD